MSTTNKFKSGFSPDIPEAQDLSILAMTVCCIDVYPQRNTSYIGGNSVNFAVQCRKKGVTATAVLGCVGTDGYGWEIINLLTKNRIDISHLYIREGTTASNRIYISDAGERYFLPDSWDGGVYQTFILSESDWQYVLKHDIVAIPANNPNFPTALKIFGGNDKLVVDFLDSRDFTSMEEVLPKVALGFISGDEEVAARLKPLSKKMNAPIVVTLGAEGSVALHGGKEYRQDAIPVETIVDTTGCGDSYQAAFTVSWWANRDIHRAMQEGSRAAAEILTRMGGI